MKSAYFKHLIAKEIFLTQLAFIQLTGKSISVGSSEFTKIMNSNMKNQLDGVEYLLAGFYIAGKKIIVPYKKKNSESVSWLELKLDNEEAELEELL